MALGKPDPFAEDLSLIKALYLEFSKKDEFDLIAAVDQDVQDILRISSAREADARAIIKGKPCLFPWQSIRCTRCQ